MKRTFIIVLLVLFSTVGQAQEGDFIYVDFEPDTCVKVVTTPTSWHPSDTLSIDFDNDGSVDFYVNIDMMSSGALYPVIHSTWDRRFRAEENDPTVPSDTIWINYAHAYIWEPLTATYREDWIGFKKIDNGVCYYAWLRMYAERIPNGIGGNYDKVWAYIDKYAYCTIPDYPLQWEQTCLNWDVEENTDVSACVHPNPTNDHITIDLPNDEDCQSIEIFSIDGRLVETFPETSHPTTINISALHTGMYIMKIRMADGREFSEKIVKE